jgi:hypothetical protein
MWKMRAAGRVMAGARFQEEKKKKFMIAVIGNMLAGLGVLSLFTATLRLTKPGK